MLDFRKYIFKPPGPLIRGSMFPLTSHQPRLVRLGGFLILAAVFFVFQNTNAQQDRGYYPPRMFEWSTHYPEYGAVMSPRGNKIIFVSQKRQDWEETTYDKVLRLSKDDRKEGIWYSDKVGSGWGRPAPILIEKDYKYIGAISFAPDGKTVYFAASGMGGSGGVDLFRGVLKGDKISQIRNLGGVNTKYWDSQPWVSPDGEYLYFSSTRPNGEGKEDIYISKIDKNGNLSSPKNAGPKINTDGSERSPFIFLDNKTLYFASDGQGGEGGLDLYRTTKNDEGSWGAIISLGTEYNSAANEDYPRVYLGENKVIFATDGLYPEIKNIYIAGISPKVIPALGTTLYGTVYDAKTKKELPASVQVMSLTGAKIEVESKGAGYSAMVPAGNDYVVNVRSKGYFPATKKVDVSSAYAMRSIRLDFELNKGQVLAGINLEGKIFDASNGKQIPGKVVIRKGREKPLEYYTDASNQNKLTIPINIGAEYNLHVESDGYLFASERLVVPKSFSGKVLNKVFRLQPIKAKAKVMLHNIYFDFNKATLKPQSLEPLNQVAKFLKEHEGMILEVGGHTDSVGSNKYNQKLSLKRAQAVVRYLKKRGVHPKQMVYKGYGEKYPAKSNKTEAGRKFNRRIVFKVLRSE